MINLSDDDSIIGYLSWCDANNIAPFDENTNIYDDMYEININKDDKVKKKNNKNKYNYGGHNG